MKILRLLIAFAKEKISCLRDELVKTESELITLTNGGIIE